MFSCTNPSCAIALSKANFPVAMNCPVCQTPLEKQEEAPIISAEDETLISSLPYVIAYPLRRTLAEKHIWTKVNLLKDTFLNYLKYLGLLSASEFFNSNLKDKKMVALFQQALAEPSFGSWNQYIRETLQFLKEQQHEFFCAELANYYEAVETGKKRKLYKGEIEYIDSNGDVQLKKQEATAIGMLINFRNRYLGHGLTLDEKAAQQLWDEYFPLFRTLLEQMQFASQYMMFKHEHGETYKMQSAEISIVEKGAQEAGHVWLENSQGEQMNILPFFVVPGEVSLAKEDKEQILAYESYTGKTIKFFSPEGTEKQSSGKILEKLNLLLRDKQKEKSYSPEDFSKEIFMGQVADENKLILDTLIAEKKVIPGVYVHREDMEIKLREWIGARMNIFFIAAEAGSGKTNLLVEMQKQYSERAIPSLLIRAGRMEKQTLREQLAYLLNIDATQDLSTYKHIAGTQASPTMVLIDGLNEAAQAEALWQEVLDISKTFEPGSLKFVVTSRANSKADIERYALAESDENLVYGENKDHEQGLGAYTHWLTALNMAEMKNAWDDYVQKDKNKYKPQFSFDDLATFDRALYNHISNPLVLRLFLETYHNKALPKKGNKHLNIWADWLATFTDAEQEFFKLLADAIWEKGENELLLDDVLENENLKSYFTDDRINAPYPRLKNNGWISRYVKDLNMYLAYTVEGALLYMLGERLNRNSFSIAEIKQILIANNRLKGHAVEALLCSKSINGIIEPTVNLIDEGLLKLCIMPIINFLKSYGVRSTIDKLFKRATLNDWMIIVEVEKVLTDLQLFLLRDDMITCLISKNQLISEQAILMHLKAIPLLSDEIKLISLNNVIEIILNKYSNNDLLLEQVGKIELLVNNEEQALVFFEKCLEIRLKEKGGSHIDVGSSYSDIGNVYYRFKNFNKALEYTTKGQNIARINLGSDHQFYAISLANTGMIYAHKGNIKRGIEENEKCLSIILNKLGCGHLFTMKTYMNLAKLHLSDNKLKYAIDYYKKALEIGIYILGENHILVVEAREQLDKINTNPSVLAN